MSNENNAVLRKLEVMTALRTSEELYTLIALTTNQPFVQCDLETYDDVVYVSRERVCVLSRRSIRYVSRN